VLIKDNHLAGLSPSEVAGVVSGARSVGGVSFVEVEVDTLDQLAALLGMGVDGPDVVLLDNMGPGELRRAVAWRDERGPGVSLEASGGITIESVGEVAGTGVDRVSVGSMTRDAVWLDFGLDA